jgi:hypothetical protein
MEPNALYLRLIQLVIYLCNHPGGGAFHAYHLHLHYGPKSTSAQNGIHLKL